MLARLKNTKAMLSLLRIILIVIFLLALYGCQVLGEEEDASSKQMILIGVVEPDNTFLSTRPEGFQLELVKDGELIDTKFIRRDIQTNTYPFEFAGIYPLGDLNLRTRHLNQYLEFYLGDASRHQGRFLIGKFPMGKAALATRYLKNLSFFPEIQQLSPSNILDILAYLISITISEHEDRAELLRKINKLNLNESGKLIETDIFFPEWQNHPQRYASTYEIQLAETLQNKGIQIPYESRVWTNDYHVTNLLIEARIVGLTENITIFKIDSQSNQLISANPKINISDSQPRIHLHFRKSLDENTYNQLLASKLFIQGRESLSNSYAIQTNFADLDPQRESSHSLSISVNKPSEQISYATHFSINDSLENTQYGNDYDLKLMFSILF